MMKRLIAAAMAIAIASPVALQAQPGGHREKDRQRSERQADSAKQKRSEQQRTRTTRPAYQRPSTGTATVRTQQYDRNRRFNDWRDDSRYRQSLQDRRTWSNNWRNDRRYDWRSYRNSNRHIYRLHRYVAPRGYNYHYRRYGIGALLQAIFFSPTYWITNPYYYRLPPAYGRYRWVRYYNDALLVDIYTGRIVDVAYGIFW